MLQSLFQKLLRKQKPYTAGLTGLHRPDYLLIFVRTNKRENILFERTLGVVVVVVVVKRNQLFVILCRWFYKFIRKFR